MVCDTGENTMTCMTDCPSCSAILDGIDCGNDANCTWDGTFCNPMGGGCNSDMVCDTGENTMTCMTDCPSCSAILNGTDCGSDSNCTWDGTFCNPMGGGCNSDMVCDTGENTMTCMTDCPSCSAILNGTDCGSDSNCTWGTVSAACMNFDYCDITYSTQSPCDGDVDCQWNAGLPGCEFIP
jgi:hypothetical protein